MIIGYLVSGIIVGALLTIEDLLGYPRSFNLVVLGIYDIFIIIHILTVVARPVWLSLFLLIVPAEIWIVGGLGFLLLFLSLAVILGITAELNPFSRTSKE